MNKRVLIALVVTCALVLSLLLATAVGANPTYVILDSVNIGDATSEPLHNLVGWTSVWTCGPWSVPLRQGNWCACPPDGDGNMRLIWGDHGETCDIENNWASVTLDAGTHVAKTLRMTHLEGAADDGFNIYVNDILVATDTDTHSTNTWVTEDFEISSWGFTGLLVVKLEATASAWSGCGTYGQVAFDMIVLEGPLPVDIDIKPGSDPNAINLGANGVIPVAIFGSAELDVSNINFTTVSLEGAEVRVKGKSGNYGSFDDLDLDGYMDVVIQVYNDMTDVLGGTATATLTGNLNDGTPIEGSDEIVVVPPE